MPRHQQVTTCRLSGGPVSRHCTCEHCTLSMCEVCGAYEGGLTTDCPGAEVNFDRQREVYETPLDYTDARGWHQGEPMERRTPRFTTTRLPPEPPQVDPRAVVSPAIDWATVDRSAGLQHELALRAIVWVLADRDCDDLSAALDRAKAETDDHLSSTGLDDHGRDLFARLEGAKIYFQRACLLVEKRDDEFRQAARRLVSMLEDHQLVPPPLPRQPTSDDPRSKTLPETQLVRAVIHALGISQEALSPEYRARAAAAARHWMSTRTRD